MNKILFIISSFSCKSSYQKTTQQDIVNTIAIEKQG